MSSGSGVYNPESRPWLQRRGYFCLEGGCVTKPCCDCRRRLDFEGFCLLLIVCLIRFLVGLYVFGHLLCDCLFTLLDVEIISHTSREPGTLHSYYKDIANISVSTIIIVE